MSDLPPGFILVENTRIAVSEIATYFSTSYNGRPCVKVVLKSGSSLVEYGREGSAYDIDRRIKEATHGDR